MKTLFITRDYLHGHGGGVYASRAYINAFAEISSYMDLVYPIKQNTDAQELSDKINHLYPVDFRIPKWRKGIRMICGKISPYNSLPKSFFDRTKYDIVVFNNSCVSQGLIEKFKKANIKIITIHHNYEMEYLRDNLSLFPWFSNFIATYFVEKKAFQQSDLNLTLTNDDINLLRKNYGGNAPAEVLGVFEYYKQEYKRGDSRNRERPTFVVTGDLSMPQTYNSLAEWVGTYYPILKRVVPKVRLIIAGKNPTLELRYLCEKNYIELIPSPVDMEEVLKQGDYYICPISKGGGLKLRILDGLKCGLPVVTHAVSARGYDTLVDGGIVFKYSNAEEFKKCILQLLNLKVSKNEIVEEYHRLFSFKSGISRLKDIISTSKILNKYNHDCQK